MRTKTKISIFIILIFAFSGSINAQKGSFEIVKPEIVGLSSDSLEKMNTYFHRLVDNKQLAGIQTAIIKDGKLIHFNSYGYSNIEEGKELNEQSIFRIFSMTKPIVSVALIKLYEEGKFKLEDPLYLYLPEFRKMKIYTDSLLVEAENPIRIIDLLRHSSGFSYGNGHSTELNQMYADANLFASRTNQEFVSKLSKLPLLFEPGTNWQYSLSTNICGYLIEVLTGKSLDAYLNEYIFTPLEMNDTHFQLPPEKVEQFSVGYAWDEELGLTVAEQQRENRYVNEVTLLNGGGGLVSTTFDYLKFCQMILNKGELDGARIVKQETIALMLQDHLKQVKTYQERLRLPPGEYGFGLGFAIKGSSYDDLEKVYGWGGAVGTYFKIDTKHNMAYVMMIQLSPYRHLGLRQLIQDFIESSIVG